MRLILLLFVVALGANRSVEWKRYSIAGTAQGTTYSIIYYADDSVVSKPMIDHVLMSLDSSLSLYKPYSGINQFNNSEKGTELDEHLFQVVSKSLAVYKETKGLFDITVQPLVQLWGFGVTPTNTAPDSGAVRTTLTCVQSSLLHLNGKRLLKKKPCVKIDLNGIAQGYSVDVLAAFLETYGIRNYMVELGGEIRVKGRKQPSGEKMRIGIESPSEDPFGNHPLQKVLVMDEGAITTSGSYRRFYESKGQKITHLIHPKTGYPQANELISVTVYAPDAITADAYDNALMLMGLKAAMDFVNKRPGLAAYFVYKNANGSIADTASLAFLKRMNP
jgi:thiamine biosynthesis lipoprotein